jgi:predicted amidohydrolase
VAIQPAHATWEALKDASKSVDLLVGFAEDGPGHRFYNSAGYFSKGQLVHLHRKLHLPTYGMFQEGREFAAGDTLRAFESPHGPAGILVCEDLWHQACAWLLAQEGAEVIYGLCNGPTRGARPGREVTSLDVWRQLLQVSAQFLTSYVVYVNRVGCEDGLTFGGGSMVVDPFGRVVTQMAALDEGVALVELSDDVLRRSRVAYPLLRDTRLELVHRELGRVRRARFDLPEDDGPAADDA